MKSFPIKVCLERLSRCGIFFLREDVIQFKDTILVFPNALSRESQMKRICFRGKRGVARPEALQFPGCMYTLIKVTHIFPEPLPNFKARYRAKILRLISQIAPPCKSNILVCQPRIPQSHMRSTYLEGCSLSLIDKEYYNRKKHHPG